MSTISNSTDGSTAAAGSNRRLDCLLLVTDDQVLRAAARQYDKSPHLRRLFPNREVWIRRRAGLLQRDEDRLHLASPMLLASRGDEDEPDSDQGHGLDELLEAAEGDDGADVGEPAQDLAGGADEDPDEDDGADEDEDDAGDEE